MPCIFFKENNPRAPANESRLLRIIIIIIKFICIYIYSQRQAKRALRLTKHHLFIVVAFAAEAMMDDDAVRGKIFCTYSLRGMPSCKTKRVKKFKKSNPTFYPRKGPSSNHHSQRGVEYHHQLNAQKLCRACEDKNDSSLGVVFMQSRSF